MIAGHAIFGKENLVVYLNLYPKMKMYEGCSLISEIGFFTQKFALPSESEY